MPTLHRCVLALGIGAAALIGGGIGFALGRGTSQETAPAVDLLSAAQSRYSSYVFAVRGGRDADARESDVRSYLAFLDARAVSPSARNSNIFAFDKALAMVRLAQIAQSRKSVDEAAAMIRSADGICPLTGLRNCSANDLLYTIRERDRHAWDSGGGGTP